MNLPKKLPLALLIALLAAGPAASAQSMDALKIGTAGDKPKCAVSATAAWMSHAFCKPPWR